MKIVAFVPIKFYSQRLENKNFLLLDNKPLCSHIFDTLNKVERIDEIYVYCSNSNIMNCIPMNRPRYLCACLIFKAVFLFTIYSKKSV